MSLPLPPVCILTAGSGTRMGPLSCIINKCLLPYKDTAIISHIITSFPEGTSFIIALGYKEKQVRDYLSIAHPSTKFHFVVVDKFVGPGTGPGYSLLCCRAVLDKPFYFISCDTLFDLNLEKRHERNWVGLAKIPKQQQISYCNMAVSKGKVTHIYDKKIVNTAKTYAFTGLMYIHDHAEFWSALEKPHYIGDEHQISNGLLGLITKTSLHYKLIDWLDVGTYEKYRQAVTHSEKYDFSKTNEFLYCHNAQIIKFFSDEKIINGRVKKAAMNPRVFPRITHVAEQ